MAIVTGWGIGNIVMYNVHTLLYASVMALNSLGRYNGDHY